MNYKSALSSWFGLGLIMVILQFSFQYFFTLIGLAEIPSFIVFGLADFFAASVFTYYFYPQIMSFLFKIYAMATTFCISLLIRLTVFLVSVQTIKTWFEAADIRQRIALSSAFILILLIDFGIQYFFITIGNKGIVKCIRRQATK